MRLLIAIINDPDKVVDILDEFYDENIKGGTVIESAGMAHIIADHVPFFSRFAELDQGKDPTCNKTIFVVVENDEAREKAIKAIESVIGDLNEPDTGIALTVPLDFCKGIVKTEGDSQ
ncbi:hypothetical protein PRVXH_002643 [Proteinivorax hydrogeniformans]|uniref:Nitrogen regulatory protein P-II family n=1 Tax=Proteinivorax hydrogeniformans TaxID=1826727 RepID=A0AAU8HTV6_9FIRM